MTRLATNLKVPLPMAVGILEMLWQFTGDSCPEGDIGSFTDKEIAAKVGWRRSPLLLIEGLCAADSRWLDKDETHRLRVHDWPDHAEYEVCRRLLNSDKDFLPVYGKSAAHRRAPGAQMRAESGNVPADSGGMRASREAKAKGSGSGLLDDFGEFRKACNDCELPFSVLDMDVSKGIWSRLDFEQKALAVKGLYARRDCGEFDEEGFRPLPQNYLSKQIWYRPLRAKVTAQSKADQFWEKV